MSILSCILSVHNAFGNKKKTPLKWEFFLFIKSAINKQTLDHGVFDVMLNISN